LFSDRRKKAERREIKNAIESGGWRILIAEVIFEDVSFGIKLFVRFVVSTSVEVV
jgi:hypothetical protein